MIGTDATAASRRSAWRRGVGIVFSLVLATFAGPHWIAAEARAQDTQSASPVGTARPASYPAPGKEPAAKTEFPAGAAPVSGPEIVTALSDHTALLPGGFVEYYAPDGKLHGLTEGKHYGGSWEVRGGDFCTLLQDSDTSICSPVAQKGDTLYWSVDGEEQASPVSTIPGNPRNLQ